MRLKMIVWDSMYGLNPSQIEYEILSLPHEKIASLLELLLWAFEVKKPFNSIHALLSIFLKVRIIS